MQVGLFRMHRVKPAWLQDKAEAPLSSIPQFPADVFGCAVQDLAIEPRSFGICIRRKAK